MPVKLLSEIWIYPLKSLGGIRLRSSRVLEKGLQYDRRWMLVDEDGKFMTQRVFPNMALFSTRLKDQALEVAHDNDSILIPLDRAETGASLMTTIWDDAVITQEVSPAISGWFTDHIGINCKLVSFPESNPRPVDPDFAPKPGHVSLADGYPLLIIGQASLDDLNKRLADPVPMNRFRPNLVFTGGEPYEEDGWKKFAIGKNRFEGIKPCGRCTLTTVDQKTGTKGIEPLATLAGYRKVNGEVKFGQNLITIDHDKIKEGDEITLFDKS